MAERRGLDGSTRILFAADWIGKNENSEKSRSTATPDSRLTGKETADPTRVGGQEETEIRPELSLTFLLSSSWSWNKFPFTDA